MNKAIESSFRIIESAHKSGNLGSFKSELKRMIKLLTKATKKIKYEDNSSKLWSQAMADLDKMDENNRNKRYENLINSN